MATLFDITHITSYRYARPVELGQHRVMFRPRDSHDLRVLATDLVVTPQAQNIHLIQDAYSNSVALVRPQTPGTDLTFTATFTVEHTGARTLDLPLDPQAEHYPFKYSAEDRIALGHYLQPYYGDDPGHRQLAAWAKRFVKSAGETGTRELLVEMTADIRDSMKYEPRYEEGVQTPAQTLKRRAGTCRDFATLMIEAVRSLGYAARFVTGYVYTAHLDSPAGAATGAAGATHAWLQVYLPGAGWLPFDPTNNLVGGTDLIRVGVARHAGLVPPISGTWHGAASDYLGMAVDVQVNKRSG